MFLINMLGGGNRITWLSGQEAICEDLYSGSYPRTYFKERRPAWAASCVGKEELLMLSVSFQLKLDTNPEMPAQWQYWLDCIGQADDLVPVYPSPYHTVSVYRLYGVIVLVLGRPINQSHLKMVILRK
jgi:hypothetical protein